jgi:protein-tyrosine phosphatase
MKIKHGKLTFEYNKITSNIYLGTDMCCQTHFKSELLKKGIEADISLEGENQDKPFGVKYYLWLPVKDHAAPTQKQLTIGTDFIESLIKNNIKIYIHCQRGHGRAATLTAAHLIKKGMTPKEAISLIKKKRPVIHPNVQQRKALDRFAKMKK